MKKYIFSGAALLLGALASPAYCITINLAFSYIPTPPGTGTITYTPPAMSGGINNVPLITFTNIPFDSVTVSGDTAVMADNGTFSFTSSGTAFAATPGTNPGMTSLTNTGSFLTASGPLFSISGLSYTAYTTNSLSNVEVGFSDTTTTTGTISSSLEAALGLTGPVSGYTVTLVQDSFCSSTPPGSFPAPPAPAVGMACAAGYNAQSGSSINSVDSQYLEVSITSAVPEPQTSLLLGCALVAVGSLARKRRQKI